MNTSLIINDWCTSLKFLGKRIQNICYLLLVKFNIYSDISRTLTRVYVLSKCMYVSTAYELKVTFIPSDPMQFMQ